MNSEIILSYNDEQKSIKVPKDFIELKEIFLNEFREDKNKKFSFIFYNEEDKDIDLSSDSGFKEFLEEVNNKLNEGVVVSVSEEKENDPMRTAIILEDKTLEKNDINLNENERFAKDLKIIEKELNNTMNNNIQVKIGKEKENENIKKRNSLFFIIIKYI